MKLIAVCIILALAATQCVQAGTAAAAATVGLFGPDRYEGIPEMCLMPMDFGYCKAKVKRYYFDMRRMKCQVFFWGGCAGNINNFKSQDECNKVCLDAFEGNDQIIDTAAKYNSNNYNSRSNSRGAVSNNSNNNNSSSSNNPNPSSTPNIPLYKTYRSPTPKVQNTTTTYDSDDYDD